MSTALEAASLIMVPSGYSDGMLGSVKPTDSSGNFTFTRGTDIGATRVAEDGYIEKGRENLLLQSNQFDESYWQKNNGCSIIGQTATDPFGVTNNAWLVAFDGTTNARLEKSFSGSAIKTMSVYVRTQSGTQEVLIGFGSSELVAKTITTTWQRIEKFTPTGNVYPRLRCDDVVTLEVFGFQVELGLAATEYIESGATTGTAGILANLPRIDYTGGGCGSLLLEPSRTNLITNSNYFEEWNSDSNVSYSVNNAISPEGLINATKVTATSTSSSFFRDNKTTSAGDNAFSVFAKYEDCQYIMLSTRFFNGGNEARVWFDIQNGVKGGSTEDAVTYDIEDYGNGWYRCYVVWNVDAGDLNGYCYVYLSSTDESFDVINGTGALFYGAQWEQGSYPTSLIPTYGTSVTRAQDVCVGAGDAYTFNSTEGVLYAEIAALADDGTTRRISITGTNANDRINISFSNGSNRIQCFAFVGGALVFNFRSTLSSIKQFNKIAVKYKENDFALWVNGVEVATDTSGISWPANTLNNLLFANFAAYSEPFYGNVKQVITFNTALSDTELTELTTI